MSFEPIWGAIIAWYLFLAGLGGGAFITSAFLGWRHPEAVNMRKVGHLIAPIVVIIGLCLLMFDAEGGLHNPLRFALLLTNFGSVMTWGVVFLGGFTIVAIIVVVLDFLKKSVPVWLDIVGVLFAVCVAVYTGALLGVCKTFPLWNNALLPILFLVSAVSAGMASVLLVAVVRHADEFNRVGVLKKFHFCLPIIELVLVASLMFITSFNSVAGWNSVMSLLVGQYAPLFWIGLVAIGLVLPTALEQLRLRRRRAGGRLPAALPGGRGRAARDHHGAHDVGTGKQGSAFTRRRPAGCRLEALFSQGAALLQAHASGLCFLRGPACKGDLALKSLPFLGQQETGGFLHGWRFWAQMRLFCVGQGDGDIRWRSPCSLAIAASFPSRKGSLLLIRQKSCGLRCFCFETAFVNDSSALFIYDQ